MKQALVNALVADVASGISLVASSFGVASGGYGSKKMFNKYVHLQFTRSAIITDLPLTMLQTDQTELDIF